MSKKLIRKMLTAAGGPFTLPGKSLKEVDEINNYNKNKAKGLFKGIMSGKVLPTMSNIGSMLGAAYNGWLDPETTAITGEPTILPSRGINPKTVLSVAKGVRTLEDYLKTTKVTAQALEESSAARSAYATDRYIGGRLFLNTLPEEAMKILGHGMAKSPTILDALARLRYILDNGIKGKFYTAPLKVSKEAAMAGEAIGTGGATPYFDGHFLITGKPGLMINSVDDIGTIYINDAYENKEALKAALKLLQYLLLTYPKINFKLYSLGFKQGGKMNILEFLKNGSGIHIKEENKGKFTSYCGGNVTDECILKGKNSSNPAIRKRATFAANARKWKHEDGGELIKKHLEGAKLTFGLKLGNFANSDLGKSVISNGLSFLLDKLFNKSASSNLEIVLAAQEKELPTIDPMQVAQMIEIARNQYADSDNPNANGGDIFNSYIKNQITAPILARQLEEHKKRLAAIDLLTNQAKSSVVRTFFDTLAQGGIEYLLNKYGKTEKADS